MFSPSKWVRSVVELLAVVLVIAGLVEVMGVRKLIFSSRGEQVAGTVRAPDPETTSSILKMMDHK